MSGPTPTSYPEATCSFCKKKEGQVQRMFAGPGDVYICDGCVETCHEMIEEEDKGQDS